MDSQDLFKHWSEVRKGLCQALDKLADAQLDFKPRQGLWSLRETVVHIAGTEDGWLRYYTANKWHENAPQANEYPTIASLKTLMDETHKITEKQFGDDIDKKVKETCKLPWGSEIPMELAVWHVIEHEIHHRGEIYLMLGLMGIEAPDV